jgi:hypothetical protein
MTSTAALERRVVNAQTRVARADRVASEEREERRKVWLEAYAAGISVQRIAELVELNKAAVRKAMYPPDGVNRTEVRDRKPRKGVRL